MSLIQFLYLSIPVTSTVYAKNLAGSICDFWMTFLVYIQMHTVIKQLNKHLYLLFFFCQRCIKQFGLAFKSILTESHFFHNLTWIKVTI